MFYKVATATIQRKASPSRRQLKNKVSQSGRRSRKNESPRTGIGINLNIEIDDNPLGQSTGLNYP